MRLCTSLLLAAVLALPVLAEPPGGAPEDTVDREKIAALVRDLDADAVESREAADSRLREMGDVVLDSVRAAAFDASIGPEGKVRAATIASVLLLQKERRRLFGDHPDPVKEVRDEFFRLGEPIDGWEFQVLSSPVLDQVLPRCLFVIADWTGAQGLPVPSEIFAVCREPAAVVRMRSDSDMTALSKWLPAAKTVTEKIVIVSVLGGLEEARSHTEGPFVFEAAEAEDHGKQDVKTTESEIADTVWHFDEEGMLVSVSLTIKNW